MTSTRRTSRSECPRRQVAATLLLAGLGTCVVSPAMAQEFKKSAWNGWQEPQAVYGQCQHASQLDTKLGALFWVGESPEGLLAIEVIYCKPADGGGGWSKVDCPKGSAFDFCIRNTSDGAGNNAEMGVIKASARTDANGPYTGCPAGATLQSKLKVLLSARKDARTIDALVTLTCDAATVPDVTPASEVDCAPRSGFGYCVATPNDGLGNAVTLGVVRAYAAGDPNTLYGECDQQIQPGFVSKASVLPLVGKSTDNVRVIDQLTCAVPWGIGGDFPSTLSAGPCVGNKWVWQQIAGRYDYCIVGTDARNNGIVMGVGGGN